MFDCESIQLVADQVNKQAAALPIELALHRYRHNMADVEMRGRDIVDVETRGRDIVDVACNMSLCV